MSLCGPLLGPTDAEARLLHGPTVARRPPAKTHPSGRRVDFRENLPASPLGGSPRNVARGERHAQRAENGLPARSVRAARRRLAPDKFSRYLRH